LASKKVYAKPKGSYNQPTVRGRIEALFLENVGKVVTREQILQAAKDPKTGRVPENWHQRLSELRTDYGYTILSWRDTKDLKVSEYLLKSRKKRPTAGRRIKIGPKAWSLVLARANHRCEWLEGSVICGLREGEQDPIGGGTVRLTPDHKEPHSVNPNPDPDNPNDWQALCGRHQVMKKNYWDDSTGWLNVLAIIQASSAKEKRKVYEFLKRYFKET
jgi:hypothetical protein